MLVAENRTNESTYNVQAIKNILFSGDTSSIHALEKLLNDTVQFDVLEQEVLDRQYIPKEAKSFFDKNGTFLYRVSNVSKVTKLGYVSIVGCVQLLVSY